jgi:hypothetical protein
MQHGNTVAMDWITDLLGVKTDFTFACYIHLFANEKRR